MNSLQWGRDTSVAETRTTPTTLGGAAPSFNGAATLQSRKPRWSAWLPLLKRGFNGAATLQSRKLRESSENYPAKWSFNGAATLQSRKRAATADRDNPVAASMGPRHFSRGNLATPSSGGSDVATLQWGRDTSVAETRSGVCVSDTYSWTLQWGRDTSVAETSLAGSRT